VNSLFQDTPAVAKGIFEGFCATAVDDFTALRTAKLDLEDLYDPEVHDTLFRCFNWHHFSEDEFSLLPNIISMGGDGATYDIGFGALSRLLVSETPVKVVVLNTGAYSNTGGQTSTASYTAQDSDLTRFGGAHSGKHEDRKELGLIAAFHPRVLVIQTNAALQSHFMKNVMDFLTYNESPAVFDTYTTCQPEHGIADDAGSRRATLAVESRMSPVFVHDPRRGDTLAERFSLEGNPDIGKDWTMTTLDYIDEDNNAALMEIPYTAADFAQHEGRFKKHFHPVSQDDDPLPIDEYIDLSENDRYGKVPFIWSTTAEGKLIKLTMSSSMVELTEERRRSWRMLEYLGGLHVEHMQAEHRRELDNWQQKYQQSNEARETSIDSIARGMAELASISGAPADTVIPVTLDSKISSTDTAAETGTAATATGSETAGGDLVAIPEADMVKCTNCKTCYQDLSELFEKTKIMVGGSPKEVGRVIPGVLDHIEITPDLVQRASRVADDCDAEIIRFSEPA
jgi:pyruvate-ferredoxin/flavodoxin oxidoreductase